MRTPILSLAVVLFSISLSACNKSEGGAAPGASGKAGAAATGATSPSAASNLPVKGPWEALRITMTKKNPDGSADFKIDNLGAKTVAHIFIDVYGYDAKGKQVVHKDRGYSIPIKGGASGEFTQDAVKDVDTWEAVYHGLKFEGDANATTDSKRAPLQRPKGG